MTITTWLTLSPAYVLFTLLGLLALAVGSLLNVIIYRLPLMLFSAWHAECCELQGSPEPQPNKINLFFPRSFCPSCKSTIPSWHNIPVFSYLLLRGRCHQCRHPISLQYPLVELLCLVLSLFCAWHFGFTPMLGFALLFVWTLIVLCFIDLEYQILPDCLTLGLLWIGLLANTQALFTSLPNAVYGAAGAYLALWLFIQLFYLITGKIGMGNGDFKLFAAFGAWFGWTLLPLILIISSITGAIVGVIYLKAKQKNKETPVPFGPFLCLAGLIALFYGNDIVRWYLQHAMQVM